MSEIYESKFKSTLIRISAHDRSFVTPNQSPTDFELNVPTSNVALKNVVAVSPVSMSLTHFFYNVYNCTFKYTRVSDNAERELKLDDGQYDVDSLLEHVVAKFNVYEPNGAMTYIDTNDPNNPSLNPITHRMSFDFGMNISFTSSINNKLAEIFGFSYDNVTYTTANNQITAPYCFDLSGENCIFIHSKALSNGASDLETTPKEVHSILSIPLANAYFGETVSWRNNSSSANLIKFNSPRQLSSIPISIRNNRGEKLNLQGSDFTLVVKCFYTF